MGAAVELFEDAFIEPEDEWGDPDRERIALRFRHLLATDPDGAWIAEEDGRAAGLAMGFTRGRLWVLGFLAVRSGTRGGGHGRALLRRALEYAEGTSGQLLCASMHPAALRLYASEGFSLLPAVELKGRVDRARLPAVDGVRDGTVDDLELCAAVDEAVRGAARSADIEMMLEAGTRLFVSDRPRGYALMHGGRSHGLAAEDEATARSLLWTMIAEAGDATVPWITAPQQWAIQVGVAAGLQVHAEGPVCVRGETGPLRPWLPNGALL
jgi:GNAT superfamily N-acetyltransferase